MPEPAALCVYALAPPFAARVRGRGMAGERLRALSVGRVTAITGELPRLPRPDPELLRKYDRVLQSLSLQLPAMIPARFGTCVQDLIELTFILQSRQEAFRTTLRAVRGRAQMTVRVLHRPAAPGDAGTDAGTSPSGTRYMRARAAEAARARDIPGFDPVRAAVRRWVRDERVDRRGNVASVYHLVPKGQAAQYRRVVERAARDAGLRVMVSGPWPAYAFSTPF